MEDARTAASRRRRRCLLAPGGAKADGSCALGSFGADQPAVRGLAAILGFEPLQHQDRRSSAGDLELPGDRRPAEPRGAHQLAGGRRPGSGGQPDLLVNPRRPRLPGRMRLLRGPVRDLRDGGPHPEAGDAAGRVRPAAELRRLQRQRGELGSRRAHDDRRPGHRLGVRLLGRAGEGQRRGSRSDGAGGPASTATGSAPAEWPRGSATSPGSSVRRSSSSGHIDHALTIAAPCVSGTVWPATGRAYECDQHGMSSDNRLELGSRVQLQISDAATRQAAHLAARYRPRASRLRRYVNDTTGQERPVGPQPGGRGDLHGLRPRRSDASVGPSDDTGDYNHNGWRETWFYLPSESTGASSGAGAVRPGRRLRRGPAALFDSQPGAFGLGIASIPVGAACAPPRRRARGGGRSLGRPAPPGAPISRDPRGQAGEGPRRLAPGPPSPATPLRLARLDADRLAIR